MRAFGRSHMAKGEAARYKPRIADRLAEHLNTISKTCTDLGAIAQWHGGCRSLPYMDMATMLPDWLGKLLPDSMGGFISLVWLILFWIFRVVAMRMSDSGTESPYRGLLCTGAAFCGVVAVTMGLLLVVALNHLQGFGIILALVSAPLFLVAALFSHLLYRGARDGIAPQAGASNLHSSSPKAADRRDAA